MNSAAQLALILVFAEIETVAHVLCPLFLAYSRALRVRIALTYCPANTSPMQGDTASRSIAQHKIILKHSGFPL